MSVIALVQQAIAIVTSVLGQVTVITTTLITTGWAVVVRDAANLTTDIHSLLEDPDCGQVAQCNKLDTVLADIATLASDIAALGSPQQTGQPVTLPTTPPAGYGGASAPATADAVWSYVNTYTSEPTLLDLARCMALAHYIGAAGSVVPGDSPWVRIRGPFPEPGGITTFIDYPPVNLDDILPTDLTVGDWLMRAYPSYDWAYSNHNNVWEADAGVSGFLIDVPISEGEFNLIKQINLGPIGGGAAAPVWPGLANVTLGTAHAMVPPGENISVPCDGVIIAITGVPSWAGSFSFGSAISWRNVGAVTFTTDDGEQEFAQTFSWSSGVYLTKSQSHAAGYAYRAAVGVTGTITPFTVNS